MALDDFHPNPCLYNEGISLIVSKKIHIFIYSLSTYLVLRYIVVGQVGRADDPYNPRVIQRK